MKFNEKIKCYIEAHDITKKEVAETAEITQSALYRFLNGTTTMKSSKLEKLNKRWPEMIAYAFSVDPHIAKEANQIDETKAKNSLLKN